MAREITMNAKEQKLLKLMSLGALIVQKRQGRGECWVKSTQEAVDPTTLKSLADRKPKLIMVVKSAHGQQRWAITEDGRDAVGKTPRSIKAKPPVKRAVKAPVQAKPIAKPKKRVIKKR